LCQRYHPTVRFWSHASSPRSPSVPYTTLFRSGSVPQTLRHPSLRGPLLELVPEPEPKRADAKNPIHLDVRLEPGDDADEVAAGIEARGGRELHPDWGELPWRVFQDPSGNELCVLPAAGPAA